MNIKPVKLSVDINGAEYKSQVKSVRIEDTIRSAPYGSASIEMEAENTFNFETGQFVTIIGDEGTVFFGLIRALSQSQHTLSNGVRITHITISCVSWAYLLMRGEFKQAVTNLPDVDKSAVFRIADYNSGILKVLREELEEQSRPAIVLGKFIEQLAHYKYKGFRLGDLISIFDGNILSEDTPYEDGPENVINGVLLTQYQGAYANNMSHWAIINQLFNVLPQFFELFCFTRLLDGLPQLSIMFRYKPVNPTRDYEYALFQEFFPQIRGTFVPSLDRKRVTELRYSFDEEDHINLVFVENPFADANGHQRNFFRKNTVPIYNAEDINHRGLRSFSVTSPFVFAKGKTKAIQQKNLRLHNALAQRIYLTIGEGSKFCRGSITQEGGTPLVAGQWVRSDSFTFYIHRVTKSFRMSEEGVMSATYVYDFERGNFENEVASFVEPDIQEENTARPKNKGTK
tara:strand:- start:7185 stop:8555 length:1371 start_codon:yes stop_codon:yes gene_type:complete